MKKHLTLFKIIVLSAIVLFACDKNQTNLSPTSVKLYPKDTATNKGILRPDPVPEPYIKLFFNDDASFPNSGAQRYTLYAYNNNHEYDNYDVTYTIATASGVTITNYRQTSYMYIFSDVSLPVGNYIMYFHYNSGGPVVGSTFSVKFTIYPQPNFQGPTTNFPSNYSNTYFEMMIAPVGTNGTSIYRSTSPILTVGQSLFSPNGNTELKLQPDGNLVLYVHNADGTKTGIWASNTVGKASATLYFQPDGNLVIKDANGNGLWASNINSDDVAFKTQTSNQPFYHLQNDGNFVLYWPEHYATYRGENACYVIAAAADATTSTPSPHFGSLGHAINLVQFIPPGNSSVVGSTFLTQ